MRGKLSLRAVLIVVDRITPADAGKTGRYTFGMGQSPGSPPRMRGKRVFIRFLSSCGRITPADAGKTSMSDFMHFRTEDHPRGCGENSPLPLKVSINTGSPPQVRGKLPYPCRSILYAGITPAGAGKTICKPALDFFAGDHPRRCGENSEPAGKTIVNVGSPPQVRGKPRCDIQKGEKTGITPADAGKTLTA